MAHPHTVAVAVCVYAYIGFACLCQYCSIYSSHIQRADRSRSRSPSAGVTTSSCK